MGFFAPWMLGGLLALGVPVFVHLLKRHITVPKPVSSLMFFERGTQSSTKHRRLKHLLLFALRFSLVLLLVLAFAQPFIRRNANDPNGRLLLIVVDHSFSMRAGGRFAAAKGQALALAAAKAREQKAQVMSIGGQLQVLSQPITDVSQLRSVIEGIEPGDGRADLGELGRNVRTLSETAHEPIDLHLFSDMQKTGMPANFADMVMPQSATLHLHPVEVSTVQANWTVEAVTAPAELPDPKDAKRSRAQAVIASYNAPAARKKVSLLINGRSVASKSVDVPANGRVPVEFAPLDVGYGFSRCEIRVSGETGEADAFPFDDASLFAVRRSDPQRVLFVHAGGDVRSQVYYGAALGAAAQASFVLQGATPEQTADLDPSRFAFVVLDDAVTLPAIFERTLAQYVTKGGSVLLVLGTRAGQGAPLPIFGGSVREVRNYARSSTTASVAQVDFTHPAMEDADPGRDNGGWAGAKIFYAAAVDSGTSRVVAQLNDGTPLLLDRQVGEGHVLLFSTGLDNLTNDLPLHPVFVAFVDRTARYLSGTERLSGAMVADAFLPLRAAGAPVGEVASVEVVDPSGKRPLSLSEARRAQTFRVAQAGFYQVRFGNGRDAVIGVNPDRRESDLAPMPRDIQQLWSGSSADVSAPQAAANAPATATAAPVSLWWYVLLLACAAAIAEALFSTGYMGTPREEA